MVVEYEKQGRLAVITLNRPEARNAVNGEVARTMESILDDFEWDAGYPPRCGLYNYDYQTHEIADTDATMLWARLL